MRVLLDENLPLEFAAEIQGHQVATVRALGWAGVKNGILLQRAASACEVFVTMDANIPHQQNIKALPFGVVLIAAPSNRLVHLRPLVSELLRAIAAARPGELRLVGG